MGGGGGGGGKGARYQVQGLTVFFCNVRVVCVGEGGIEAHPSDIALIHFPRSRWPSVCGGGGGIVAHSSDIAVIRFLRPRCPSVSGVGVLWLTHQMSSWLKEIVRGTDTGGVNGVHILYIQNTSVFSSLSITLI